MFYSRFSFHRRYAFNLEEITCLFFLGSAIRIDHAFYNNMWWGKDLNLRQMSNYLSHETLAFNMQIARLVLVAIKNNADRLKGVSWLLTLPGKPKFARQYYQKSWRCSNIYQPQDLERTKNYKDGNRTLTINKTTFISLHENIHLEYVKFRIADSSGYSHRSDEVCPCYKLGWKQRRKRGSLRRCHLVDKKRIGLYDFV